MSARSPPGGMDGCRSSAPIRLPPGTAPAGPVYLAPRLVYLSSPSRRGSMVGVAQSVRAPDCGSGGRRFDPGRPPSSRPRSGRQWQTRVHSRNAVDTPRGFRYCEGLPCFCRSTAGSGMAAHPLGGNAANRVPERLRLRGVQPHRCLTIEVMRSGRALPPRSTVSSSVSPGRGPSVPAGEGFNQHRFRTRDPTRSTVQSSCSSYSNHGEFDPGSGRTLAACFIHASRTRDRVLAPGAEWRTGE